MPAGVSCSMTVPPVVCADLAGTPNVQATMARAAAPALQTAMRVLREAVR